MDYAIRVKNLKKKYEVPLKQAGSLLSYFPLPFVPHQRSREFWALKGVDLEVTKGKMLGIIGSNGSGKSTLLKIISGIVKPTSGQVEADGLVAALLELGTGFHEELSGMENIFLNGAILGFTKSQIKSMVAAIIEFSGLGEFINTPIKHYSSGMLARLGFSIAVNVDPQILLVDEVISVGDIEFQSKCIAKIAEFREKGRTIVLVTHEIDVANYLCDDIAWMENGMVQSLGNAEKVAREYRSHVHSKMAAESGDREFTEVLEATERQIIAEDWQMKTAENNHSIIRNVRILNDKGVPQNQFKTHEPMTLEIYFNTGGQTLKRPEVRIYIRREDNILITDLQSTEQGFPLKELEGQGAILVHFHPLFLFKGKYDISILLYDYENPDHVYDRRIREDHFEVTTRKVYGSGIAELPAKWSLVDES